MFINSIFIDEFQTIQWDLSYNLIPKFGYCSSKFDDVANGKSLVQGQLVLNFVSPGYLIGALMGKAPAYTPSLAGLVCKSSWNPHNLGFLSLRPLCHLFHLSSPTACPQPTTAAG